MRSAATKSPMGSPDTHGVRIWLLRGRFSKRRTHQVRLDASAGITGDQAPEAEASPTTIVPFMSGCTSHLKK
jgi:hypothetical protein